MVGLVLLAAALAWIAAKATLGRREAQRIAESRRLALLATESLDERLDLALLLSVEAYRAGPTIEAASALQRAVTSRPGLQRLFWREGSALVGSVSFGPGGELVTVDDAEVRRWDAESGRPLGGSLRWRSGPLRHARFALSSSPLRLASSEGGEVRIRDPSTGEEVVERWKAHDDRIAILALSADGRWLASAADEGEIRLWNLEAPRPVSASLRGHQGFISSLAFSAGGTLLASGGTDNRVRIWDVEAAEPIGTPLRGHGTGEGLLGGRSIGVSALAFAPDGSILASGGVDVTVRLWEVATGAQIGEPIRVEVARGDGASAAGASVHALAFSPDGRSIAAAGLGLPVRVWDVETRRRTHGPLRLARSSPGVASVAFSPDGERLAAGGPLGAQLWSLGPGSPEARRARHAKDVPALVLDPWGDRWVSGGADGTIRTWDPSTGRAVGEPLEAPEGWVTSVAVAPGGRLLASGHLEGAVQLWSAGERDPVGTLRGHESSVTALAFDPDGRWLASGGRDGAVRIWDVTARRAVGEPLPAGAASVRSVVFTPDGDRLVSGGGDDTIRFWDASTGRPLGDPIDAGAGGVESLALSADGALLASAGERGIRVWDVATRRALAGPLRSPGDARVAAADGVAFSPDGARLASGHRGSVRLWDVAARRQIGAPFEAAGVNVGVIEGTSVAFSADGRRVAAAGDDPGGRVRIWDVDPTSWASRACELANRGFTRDEWLRFFGRDAPYRRTCPPE